MINHIWSIIYGRSHMNHHIWTIISYMDNHIWSIIYGQSYTDYWLFKSPTVDSRYPRFIYNFSGFWLSWWSCCLIICVQEILLPDWTDVSRSCEDLGRSVTVYREDLSRLDQENSEVGRPVPAIHCRQGIPGVIPGNFSFLDDHIWSIIYGVHMGDHIWVFIYGWSYGRIWLTGGWLIGFLEIIGKFLSKISFFLISDPDF